MPTVDLSADSNDDEPDPSVDLFTKVFDTSNANHSDSTGRFPIPPQRGNNYVLDSVFKGYVYCVAMPSRKGPAFVKEYDDTFAHFRDLGHVPSIQRLDNETSDVLEWFFRTQTVVVQYVPAHHHREMLKRILNFQQT